MHCKVRIEEPFLGEFKDDMFPIELVSASLASIEFGDKEFKDDDQRQVFLAVVRWLCAQYPSYVNRAVEERLFSWLSRRTVESPAEWFAANRLWVGIPCDCREMVVRLYNLWNACGLRTTDLLFVCKLHEDDIQTLNTKAKGVPVTPGLPSQKIPRTAAEILAEETRQKVAKLGRAMLTKFGFFVFTAFEQKLALAFGECLPEGYGRSVLETLLSAAIDHVVFCGQDDQRIARSSDKPPFHGEEAIAAVIRNRLISAHGWLSLKDIVADIEVITESWTVPFIEDVMLEAIPVVKDGVFGYRLLETFSFPLGFEAFLCDGFANRVFHSRSETMKALTDRFGNEFWEDYHLDEKTLQMIVGYYAELCDADCLSEWMARIRPVDLCDKGGSVPITRGNVKPPVDFKVIPLASSPNQIHQVPGHVCASAVVPDSSQRQFICNSERFIRLLAPAGSGKTTTLLFRCRHLLEGTPDGRILLLTFTRVAAEELRRRMRECKEFVSLLGHVDVTTLNAYGYRIVRHAFPQSRLGETSSRWKVFALGRYLKDVLKMSSKFCKYADDDWWMREHSRSLFDFFDTLKTLAIDHEEVLAEASLKAKIFLLAKAGLGPSNLFELSLKGLHESGWLAASDYNRQYKEMVDSLLPLYSQAAEVMKENRVLTFEDQKYWAWKLLKMPGMRMERNGYAHIMVDEFQDVNPIDVELVKSLRALNDSSLTIVGDDDQTIFEWRGATPRYIVSPREFFSSECLQIEFASCQLNVNYRSPSNIVSHAQSLIACNKERKHKMPTASSTSNAVIQCMPCDDYEKILDAILADVDSAAFHSVAVITRKRSHLIPYQILLASQDRDFFAAEDLNVMLGDAFSAVLNLLEIHEAANFGLADFDNDLAIDLLNAVRTFHLGHEKAESVRDIFSDRKYKNMSAFVEGLIEGDFNEVFSERGMIYGRRLRSFLATDTVAESIECLANDFSGLRKSFSKATDDVFFADPPFDELIDFSKRYGDDYQEFLFDVRKAIASLGQIVNDQNDKETKPVDKGGGVKLHLMTGLRTKGKEFDSVYVLHAEDGVWPNPQAIEAGFDEGERRLFYVAMTRARRKLSFVFCGKPTQYLHEAGILE